MAYTICNEYGDPKPIRIITPNPAGEPEVKAEFTPFWWVCDPCNPQDKRYEVTYRADQEKPQYLQWFELVTSDDTEHDITEKIAHYKRVIAARKALDAAAVEYRRLTNCGWSVMPSA